MASSVALAVVEIGSGLSGKEDEVEQSGQEDPEREQLCNCAQRPGQREGKGVHTSDRAVPGKIDSIIIRHF